MFGANATATNSGHLLQLRALDWDVDGKYKYSEVLYILIAFVLIV